MNRLHPGVKWIFRLRTYPQFLFLGFFIFIWFNPLMKSYLNDNVTTGLIIYSFIYLLFIVLGVEIYVNMEYNRYLYKIDKDFIKLEKGIIWKKYTSIPYEKVQNINIKRGIIARMCGFSTVDIETAGQSGYGGHYNGWSYSVGNFKQGNNKGYQSEGYLPAIDLNEAEEIRKFIMKRVKNTSDEAV